MNGSDGRDSFGDLDNTEPKNEDTVNNQELSNIWLIGILSPVLILTLLVLFYISYISEPVAYISNTFGIMYVYFVAYLVSIACIFADSRNTPDRYPGNRLHQVAISVDGVGLVLIMFILLLSWATDDGGGGGVAVGIAVVLTIPVLLIPSGTAIWYVWMRRRLLADSQSK